MSIVGGLIVISGIAGAATGGSSTSKAGTGKPATASSKKAATPPKTGGTSEDQASKQRDIAVQSCASKDGVGWADATVVVTNHSSKPSNYWATIIFETKSGQQIGTGDAVVNELQPGQSSTPQDVSSLQNAPTGGYTCRVGEVLRYAS